MAGANDTPPEDHPAVASGTSAGRTSEAPVVPTARVALPSVDLSATRESLAVFSSLMERVEAQADLSDDHAILQQAYRDQVARADRFEADLNAAYAAASPYVLHCQHQYDFLFRRYQETRQMAADFETAVRERLDNSHEIAAMRDRLRVAEEVLAEETTRLQAEIADLTRRLADAESPAAKRQPQGSARRLATLQEGLDQAIADRDRVALDLAEANKNLACIGGRDISTARSERASRATRI
uniref:Uncharacterized protein n=1 Tax=Phytophthora ramorum TaxID=164328 RepID=H3H6R3_PHYRM